MSSVASLATIAAGIFASIGAFGLFASPLFKEVSRRTLIFKVGNFGFTLGGLILMLAGAEGVSGSKELFGGLLMVVFGTGASLLPAKSSMKTPDEPAEG